MAKCFCTYEILKLFKISFFIFSPFHGCPLQALIKTKQSLLHYSNQDILMFVEHSLNLTLVAAETEHLLTKINYPALIREQKNRLIIHEKMDNLSLVYICECCDAAVAENAKTQYFNCPLVTQQQIALLIIPLRLHRMHIKQHLRLYF